MVRIIEKYGPFKVDQVVQIIARCYDGYGVRSQGYMYWIPKYVTKKLRYSD